MSFAAMTIVRRAFFALTFSLPVLLFGCESGSSKGTPTPEPFVESATSSPEASPTPTAEPTEAPTEAPQPTQPPAPTQAPRVESAVETQPTAVLQDVAPAPTEAAVSSQPAGNVVTITSGYMYSNTSPQPNTTYECAPGVALDGGKQAQYAFSGSAANVTIRNCIIENYATPSQRAAIDPVRGGGTGWVIESNEIRYNADTGIYAASGASVRNNNIHHNGRNGMKASGSNIRIEGNEIAYNNSYCPVTGSATSDGCNNPNFEAGGTKFVYTTGLSVIGNHVHDNCGPGLWTDINNDQTTYANNVVENNSRAGIFHEISYSAKIANNTVRNNGSAIQVQTPVGVRACASHPRSLGQIQIDFSSGVEGRDIEVTGNTIEKRPSEDGIYVIGGFRADNGARYAPTNGYQTRNVWVHDNYGSGACLQTEGAIDSSNLLDAPRC